MRLAIFVDQFPIRSQTFVLNQITGLIDLGVDVTIVATRQGDTSFDYSTYRAYDLQQRCIYLLDPQQAVSKLKILRRLTRYLTSLLQSITDKHVLSKLFKAVNWRRYHEYSNSLLLPTIVANTTTNRFTTDSENILDFDIILTHFGTSGVLVNYLRELGVLSGKTVTIFHGFELSVDAVVERYRQHYQQLFKQGDVMLPISQRWADKLQTLGCPPEKLQIHRMGVELELFSYQAPKKRSYTKQPFTIFTVARFTEKKGLCYSLEAIASLPEDMGVKYLIAGYGPLEADLKAQVDALDISGRVEFLGPMNSNQVETHLADADAFIQPSITASDGDMEGVPVSLMEAMAVGTPVISTYHSGIPELITHNVHGLLAPESDAEALAKNIELLYHDAELHQRLSRQARKQIEEMADVNQLNRQLLELLTNLARAEAAKRTPHE